MLLNVFNPVHLTPGAGIQQTSVRHACLLGLQSRRRGLKNPWAKSSLKATNDLVHGALLPLRDAYRTMFSFQRNDMATVGSSSVTDA